MQKGNGATNGHELSLANSSGRMTIDGFLPTLDQRGVAMYPSDWVVYVALAEDVAGGELVEGPVTAVNGLPCWSFSVVVEQAEASIVLEGLRLLALRRFPWIRLATRPANQAKD